MNPCPWRVKHRDGKAEPRGANLRRSEANGPSNIRWSCGDVAFLILDGLINANPLAQQLYTAYRPITRATVNAFAGSLIDLAYGPILVGLLVVLRPSLPGQSSLVKGLSFWLHGGIYDQ